MLARTKIKTKIAENNIKSRTTIKYQNNNYRQNQQQRPRYNNPNNWRGNRNRNPNNWQQPRYNNQNQYRAQSGQKHCNICNKFGHLPSQCWFRTSQNYTPVVPYTQYSTANNPTQMPQMIPMVPVTQMQYQPQTSHQASTTTRCLNNGLNPMTTNNTHRTQKTR